jgi:hypothetical protein
MPADPYKLIEEAEAATDVEVRRRILGRAIEAFEVVDEVSAKVSFARGYAWYLMPEDSQQRHEQVLRHLGDAIRQQPEHPYARLYLAHHYFDLGQHALALPILREFAPSYFAGFGQAWRDVKIAELIVCCVIEVRDDTRVGAAMKDLLQRANRVGEVDLPEPRELTAMVRRKIRRTA